MEMKQNEATQFDALTKNTKERKQGKRGIIVCFVGSIILPYFFILIMGLLENLGLFQMHTTYILVISALLFIGMFSYAIYSLLKNRRSKK